MTLFQNLFEPLMLKTIKNRAHHVKERHQKHSWCYFYYLRPPARPSSLRPRNMHWPKISSFRTTTISSDSQALRNPLLNSPQCWTQIHLHIANADTPAHCWRDLTSFSSSDDTWFDTGISAKKRPKLGVFGGKNQPLKRPPRRFRGNNNHPH